MTTIQAPTLPAFSGDRIAFQSYERDLMEIIVRASTGLPYGAAGFVLAPPAYGLLAGGAAFNPFMDQGPEPAGVGAAHTTWATKQALFVKQQDAQQAIAQAIIRSLSNPVKARIAPAVFATMTLSTIYAALTLYYGQLEPKDLSKLTTRLQQPFIFSSRTCCAPTGRSPRCSCAATRPSPSTRASSISRQR